VLQVEELPAGVEKDKGEKVMNCRCSWCAILSIVTLISVGRAGDTLSLANPLRFAVIGDRTDEAQEGVYESILDEVERLRPDFVLTVGDAIQGYTEDTTEMNDEWQEYLSLLDHLTMPIYFTPGNHDITTEAMRPMYERYIGSAYYSFDIEGCHFIVLDNTPGAGGPAQPLGEEQWRWLVDDLTAHADARFTFVFCHKPFWYENRFANKPDSLHDLLVRHGVDAVFTGHYHHYFSDDLDGIKYTGVGSSGGDSRTPFEYLRFHFVWVTVDNEGVHIAPIDRNSVQPWDYATAEDVRMANRMESFGVQVTAPIGEKPVRTPGSGFNSVKLLLHNLSDGHVLDDTLRWEVPEDWRVDPIELPITLNPGERRQVDFTAVCEGRLFPTPTASLKCPLSAKEDITVEASLWVARQQICAWAAPAPTIDGRLSEAFWTDPAAHLFQRNGDATTIDSTWFYFAYDDANLYLGAHCRESVVDSLRAAIAERDGAVYGEDCVGYFFSQAESPDRASDTVFQVYVNPLGTVFDQKIVWDSTGWYTTKRDWNIDSEIATVRGADFWSLEARVPLSELNIRLKGAGPLYLNFRRKQKRLNSTGDWQVPIEYDPHTYGRLEFAGQEKPGSRD
jgi:hypothetical protein